MDKSSFGYKVVITKSKHTDETRFASKMAMFQHAFEFRVIIHLCYSQQIFLFVSKIPTPQIWAIVKNIVSTLTSIVSSCVLNQHCGYWLLNDALANVITFV
jgi:hypothetical protein